MLGETYPIVPSPNKHFFIFYSKGAKGVIKKVVLLQTVGQDRYNLAFGDVQGGEVNDAVISGNNDFVKILSTVAKCVYVFIESHPGAILEIKPVDARRKALYNAVFKRHWQTIEKKFRIMGVIQNQTTEPYSLNTLYDEFELHHIS